MKIEISNLTEKTVLFGTVDKKVFSTVAKIVLKGENRETEILSLAFVNKEEIRKLNKQFRKKDKATDVLSFELNDENIFGEIVICPEVVRENAKKYGVAFEKEMLKVFVHGILHLCGYDHEKSRKEEKIMDEKQEKYLSIVK